MARAHWIKTNFTTGEVSPRLLGRTDFDKYRNGCLKAQNVIVLPSGGLMSRPGLHFVSAVKNSANGACRLIPFQFNTIQAYVCEFGDQYIRFYTNNGQLQSSPGVTVEVASPYLTADLFGLKYAQNADVMYIVRNNYAPYKLQRTTATTFTLTQVNFTGGPFLTANATGTTMTASVTTGSGTLTASSAYFLAGHVGALFQLTVSGTVGVVQVTSFTSSTVVNITVQTALGGTTAVTTWAEGVWSTVQGFPAAVCFHQNRLVFGGATNNPQRFDGSVNGNYESFAPGSASATDAYNFTINTNQVNAILWMGSGALLMIGTSGAEFTADGNPAGSAISPTSIQVKPQSTHGSTNVVPQFIGNSILFVQRSGRKVRQMIFNLVSNTFIAPNVTALSDHMAGPWVNGSGPLGNFTDCAYEQEPWSLVHYVRSDGQLATLTWEPLQEVLGWARQVTGPGPDVIESVASIPNPNGLLNQTWVEVARIVNGTVNRYIEYFDYALSVDSGLVYNGQQTGGSVTPAAGATILYQTNVQFSASASQFAATDVGKEIWAGSTQANGRALITGFVDAQHVLCTILVPFTGTQPILANNWYIAVPAVSGITQLTNQMVAVQADGATYPQQTVTSAGTITINPPAAMIQVGLSFVPTVTPVRPEVETPGGTTQGLFRRISRAFLRLDATLGVALNGKSLPTRSLNDPMGQASAPFTGDMMVSNLGWDRDGYNTITQPNPLPMTLLAMFGTLDTGDDE